MPSSSAKRALVAPISAIRAEAAVVMNRSLVQVLDQSRRTASGCDRSCRNGGPAVGNIGRIGGFAVRFVGIVGQVRAVGDDGNARRQALYAVPQQRRNGEQRIVGLALAEPELLE